MQGLDRNHLSRQATRSAVVAARLSSAMISLLGSTALAQTSQRAAAPPEIGEIIVTAQRVAEPLSKTPVTVSVFTGADIAKRNYASLEDFKGSVPGLQVNNYVGEARMNIRGIGENSLSLGVDSQVAFSINGVYVGQAFSAAEAFLDLGRIEILRGPQGTLYGRNAIGGTINLYSSLPKDQREGYGEISVGNYGAVQTEAVISGPLRGDAVLGRLAVSTENHGGYSHNLFDGKNYDNANAQTVRGTLLFNFSPTTTLTLVADYHHEDDGDYATHLFGKSPGFDTLAGVSLGGSTIPLDAKGQAIDPRLLNINTIPLNVRNGGGISADFSWKINDVVSFKSISAYRRANVVFTQDFDQTPAAFPGAVANDDMYVTEDAQQFSQEFQVSGKYSRLSWVSGVYFFNQHFDPAYYSLGINVATVSAPHSVPLTVGGTSNTDAYAAYGQATFHATDKLSATAGLRYSYERRTASVYERLPAFGVNVTTPGKVSFDDISPKFTVSYQASQRLMYYATISKGFQSGGFDLSAAPPPPPAPLVSFKPETLWDYEGGLKLREQLFTLDLSAFHYDYTNLQVAQIVDGLPKTTNAASSTVNGVELSTTVSPVRNLRLTTSVAFLDAEFTKFTENDPLTGLLRNLSGNALPGSTRESVNVTANYSIPLRSGVLAAFGEWNWRDRVYFTEFNSNQVSQAPVSTLNASLRFTPGGERWFVELYARNLTNALIASQKWITGAGFGSMVLGNIDPPRTFGARLHFDF